MLDISENGGIIMDKEWENYLADLKAKVLHLECAFGCEFYRYTCSGNPETNWACPSAIVCDENGNEVAYEYNS